MRITSGGNVGIGYTGLYNQISGGENTLAIGDADNASLYLKSDATGGHNHILFSGTGGSLSFYDKTRGDYNMIIDNVGNVGIGTTSPNSLLELDGAIGIGGASGDSNVSISTTAFTAQSAGSLHINWGVQGSAANGSTVVFTYAATSWKSWTLKYNFASTNGITQGVIGGYNNSSSSGGSSVYDINELGCSAVATNSGQTVIVTFTFTALGVHPMTSFVYMQSGSDGQPRADRVSLQANNAV